MRDFNIHPCRWHMRIWDVENNEWLCENDKDALPYYGFDIRGGEVTAIQGMSGVYNAFAHGREFIWEQSTGLKDKNGKEIYEGDIMEYDACLYRVFWDRSGFNFEHIGEHGWTSQDVFSKGRVVGNIHENSELLGSEE